MNIVLLKIETTHLQILNSKIYFINKFCNIFNIKFTNYRNKNKIYKFSLLKSPHIHKKTWRKYNKRYFIIHYKLNINNNKYLIYLYILLKLLSSNSKISCKYLKK